MGTFNSPMQSMTLEEDVLSQVPVDGTWYEITNYSGVGRLDCVQFAAITTNTGELRITVDGNAHTIPKATTGILATTFWSYASVQHSLIPSSVEFQSTLVVEMRRDGDTNAITGWVGYGILSKEFKREIIPAGQPVPDKDGNPRPKNYPFDIMLVWFTGSAGDSNKIQFPQKDIINLEQTEIQDSEFITDLNSPRMQHIKTNFTGIKTIDINDIKYDLTVNNGVIELASIPNLITKEAFLDRFTADEQAEIIFQSREHATAAVRKGLQDLLFQIQTRNKINLRWSALITKVNQLETFGLIDAGRAAQILA